jgi:hypothetical protein
MIMQMQEQMLSGGLEKKQEQTQIRSGVWNTSVNITNSISQEKLVISSTLTEKACLKLSECIQVFVYTLYTSRLEDQIKITKSEIQEYRLNSFFFIPPDDDLKYWELQDKYERLLESLDKEKRRNDLPDGRYISKRALSQSLYAWGQLTIIQIHRGLKLKDHGKRSIAGQLGLLKFGAISKIDSSTWAVTDTKILEDKVSHLGFGKTLFPPKGVEAMKKRAHQLAQSKT